MIENNITGVRWQDGEILLRQEERETFETKRFKQEHPEIAKDYLKTSKVYKLIGKGSGNENI